MCLLHMSSLKLSPKRCKKTLILLKKNKENFDKNLKRKTIEEVNVDDEVYLHNNTRKRKKMGTLKPAFHEAFRIESLKNDVFHLSLKVNSEIHNRKNLQKGNKCCNLADEVKWKFTRAYALRFTIQQKEYCENFSIFYHEHLQFRLQSAEFKASRKNINCYISLILLFPLLAFTGSLTSLAKRSISHNDKTNQLGEYYIVKYNFRLELTV